MRGKVKFDDEATDLIVDGKRKWLTVTKRERRKNSR